jgi:hypothetical protein
LALLRLRLDWATEIGLVVDLGLGQRLKERDVGA